MSALIEQDINNNVQGRYVLICPYYTFRCLNYEGVGWRTGNVGGSYSLPDVGKTNNNGMKATVELLEAIADNRDTGFAGNPAPSGCPPTAGSA